MKLGIEVGLGHGYTTAGWIKMPLGTAAECDGETLKEFGKSISNNMYTVP